MTSLVAFWDVNVCLQCGGGGGGVQSSQFQLQIVEVFNQAFFLFSVCVKNDSRPRVGDERLLRILVHVCLQEDILYITCAYTTDEFSQDFYVGC